MDINAICHLAGPTVVIGRFGTQRCLICGEELVSYYIEKLGEEGTIAQLAIGGIYEFVKSGQELLHIEFVEMTEKPWFHSDLDIPENMCIRVLSQAQETE